MVSQQTTVLLFAALVTPGRNIIALPQHSLTSDPNSGPGINIEFKVNLRCVSACTRSLREDAETGRSCSMLSFVWRHPGPRLCCSQEGTKFSPYAMSFRVFPPAHDLMRVLRCFIFLFFSQCLLQCHRVFGMHFSFNVSHEFHLQGRPIRFYIQNAFSLATHFHILLNRYRFRPIWSGAISPKAYRAERLLRLMVLL